MGLLFGVLQLVIVLPDIILLEVAKHQSPILLSDLLLQSSCGVEHDLEFPSHLCNLLIGLYEVLCMQVAVHANSIVEVFLLVALGLDISNLLLQLRQHCISRLEFFQCRKVLGIRLCQLHAILLALLVQLEDAFLELLCITLPPTDVLHEVHLRRLLPLHNIDLSLGALICLDDILIQDVSLAEQVFDLLAINISILLLRVQLLLHRLQLLLQLLPLYLELSALVLNRALLLLV
mmetsp:Transcript_51967/g.121685  ORF Transcript_51967/g.121685 Transcript_51967/m.121685 type:complete len:234 (-) Transcript_51967:1029-1730(-)